MMLLRFLGAVTPLPASAGVRFDRARIVARIAEGKADRAGHRPVTVDDCPAPRGQCMALPPLLQAITPPAEEAPRDNRARDVERGGPRHAQGVQP